MKSAAMLLGGVLFLAGCSKTVTGHGSVDDVKSLIHTAVEQFIGTNLGATGVVCNAGKDFAMLRDGATFTCTADGGKSFTVTIKNRDQGDYQVS